MGYTELKQSPPTLKVITGAKDILIKVVASMCDNKYTFRMKKNSEGEFKLSTAPSAFSNFGIKYDKTEIEWEADAGRMDNALAMINTGYIAIKSVQSR